MILDPQFVYNKSALGTPPTRVNNIVDAAVTLGVDRIKGVDAARPYNEDND